MRKFAARTMKFRPRRNEGQPANSGSDFDVFADGPGGAALDERAALRLSRSKFARVR